jgi:hypothetical protein
MLYRTSSATPSNVQFLSRDVSSQLQVRNVAGSRRLDQKVILTKPMTTYECGALLAMRILDETMLMFPGYYMNVTSVDCATLSRVSMQPDTINFRPC